MVRWMDREPTRKVVHVDMDPFFESVEQRDDPALRRRPVAVGSSPAARGVVAAASYDARQFGVRSTLPSVTALRRCPEPVFVKPRFDIYRAVSRTLHAIFADYKSLIQPLSLDAAYLDVSENLRGLRTAWSTAREIRARIAEETGLTASAGISYDKFLAKLASGHRKPNCQFAVTPDMAAPWVESSPIGRCHGVGPVTARKVHTSGIENGADLNARSTAFLQEHFGSAAAWYFAIARGQDDRLVDPDRTRKSSGSEATFDRDLAEAAEIEAGVLSMADDVWTWCETARPFGRTVTVKVKSADFEQVTRSRSYPDAVVEHAQLRQASLDLIRLVFPPEKEIRLVDVTVSKFEAPVREDKELPLFGSAVRSAYAPLSILAKAS